ncbi:MAG TPA: transglutaminase-like domain-containing protein [Acetivibrio clariflavus]|nr:transglutaminase-like domain-containing protein [Acetivibrio clariflavus]
MLNFNDAGAGGGDISKSGSLGGNNKQPKASPSIKNKDSERNDDWQDRVERRRAERKRSDNFDRSFSYGEGQESEEYGSGEFTTPEDLPNVDISGENILPDIPFGSGESIQTIVFSNEKQPHTPVFEVLGYPNYPFLKVVVLENYYNNHWIAVKEEPEVVINFDANLDEKYSANSVKIKPIFPSSGYLPVLSGKIGFKYRTNVNRYRSSETYYSENVISDFYSMDYADPVGYDQLRHANTDDLYSYSISVPEFVEKIVDDIIEGCNSDFDIIKGVENYLLSNYYLNNEVINNYGQNDGIISFLMNKGGAGNTLDFMSAYTYLLRAAGIPCRLVIGYRINQGKPYQVVYRDQAYIYPEIKFAEYGWIPMDVFGYNPTFTPPIETVTQITSVSSEAKRGTNFTVKGTVTDLNGKLLDDMSVLVYVKTSKTENTLSYARAEVHDGKFEVTCDVKHNIAPGKYQVVADLLENDMYRTSTSDPEIRITTDTRIELIENDTVVGKSFRIEGSILDSYSNEGVPALKIKIKFQGTNIEDSVLSHRDGKFSMLVDLKELGKLQPERNFFFVKGYNISYQLEFAGTDIFYPSSNAGNTFIWHILWVRIVLTLLLIVSIISFPIVIGIVRGRENETKDLSPAMNHDFSNTSVSITGYNNNLANDKETERKINIKFPQIKNGYPDVWGVNEELIISFEDSWQNRDEKKINFDKKGTYSIKVLKGPDKITQRDIRIVNYREEVITNGKMLLKEFSKTIDINDKMTLREILFLMKSQLSTMKYMILEQVFDIMEKAVYSLNDISREDYELFYMCIQKYKSLT